MLEKLKNIFNKPTNTETQETPADVFMESVKDNPEIFATEYLLSDPRVVGWSSLQEQYTIYAAMSVNYDSKTQTLLDVGCGRADLYGYLTNVYENTNIQYYGIDENPNMTALAKSKYPSVQVEAVNVLDTPDTRYDWVMGVGLFNYPKVENYKYIEDVIHKMWEKADIGMSFNIITSLPDDTPESDQENLNVLNLGYWTNYVVSKYQKVLVRSNYMIGDSIITIFK